MLFHPQRGPGMLFVLAAGIVLIGGHLFPFAGPHLPEFFVGALIALIALRVLSGHGEAASPTSFWRVGLMLAGLAVLYLGVSFLFTQPFSTAIQYVFEGGGILVVMLVVLTGMYPEGA